MTWKPYKLKNSLNVCIAWDEISAITWFHKTKITYGRRLQDNQVEEITWEEYEKINPSKFSKSVSASTS